jgi:glucans biosynthesis protein
MHWGCIMREQPPLATVFATRTGIGGVIGQPRKYLSCRSVVDFVGDNLQLLGKNAKVIRIISASRGEVELTSARPLELIRGYRLTFDLRPTDSNTTPTDLRAYIASGERRCPRPGFISGRLPAIVRFQLDSVEKLGRNICLLLQRMK